MRNKTAEELHETVARILMAAGADRTSASRVADGLVSANLSGVDPHGVFHLPGYVADIRAGFIVADARPEIISETPATALVTGNWGFGFVAAKYALDTAVGKARETGIAVVGLVQCGHIGRLGEYAEMAGAEGMVSFTWAGGYSEEQQSTVPYGGRGKVLHTNPLSIGFPGGEEPPLMMDFATTGMSGSKVVLAQNRGEQVPPGNIVDRDGTPTTDPEDFFNGGAHLPFGGHKGYAIMLAVEYMGRILTGSHDHAEDNRGGVYNRRQGITMIVHKADLFSPMGRVTEMADEMARRLRAVPPAPGFDEVLVPGDLEARTRAVRQRDGIPVPDDVWGSLTELAASLDVSIE